MHEFIIDLKREGGTDIISDPKMVLSKIYSTSLLSKYSTNKYEQCPLITNLLQIIRRTRAKLDISFPKFDSISCNINTELLSKDFYIRQVNTNGNGRHLLFATYEQ